MNRSVSVCAWPNSRVWLRRRHDVLSGLEGQPRSTIAQQVALIRDVGRDYFATVGAILHEGRFFSASDVSAVRRAIWSLDKNEPVARIQTMEEIVAASSQRFH